MILKCNECHKNIFTYSNSYFAHDHRFCSEQCRRYWILYREDDPDPIRIAQPLYPQIYNSQNRISSELIFREYVNLPTTPIESSVIATPIESSVIAKIIDIVTKIV